MSEAVLSRRGWRSFQCEECGHRWEEATRDYWSPSGVDCPLCQGWTFPSAGAPDLSLPVDSMGNLTLPWGERSRPWPPNSE